MNINCVTAGILAGGRHTRMGMDKLLLTYKGKAFLEHIYEECSIFPERIVSVADRKKYAQFPYHFIEDELKEYGPLEGIYQLLVHTKREYVFALAADMPRIKAGFLRAMTEKLQDEDCLVLETEDGLHPLCAIYSKNIISKLEQMRSGNIRKPRLLYEQCKVRYVSAAELGYPDTIVQNVNTPEEYERLVAEDEID